jgi:hypothetical protein
MSQSESHRKFRVLVDFHFHTVLVSVEKSRGNKQSLQFELYGVVNLQTFQSWMPWPGFWGFVENWEVDLQQVEPGSTNHCGTCLQRKILHMLQFIPSVLHGPQRQGSFQKIK